jgi:hypothetical protein
MTTSIDPNLLALLQSKGLQGNGAPIDTSQIYQQIAERYSDNPMMSLLLSQMAERNVTDEEDDYLVIDAEEVDEDDLFSKRKSSEGSLADKKTRARIKSRIQSMSEELSVLRQHSEELAAALGACEICWGYDNECEHCNGYGSPGWQAPRRGVFNKYVEPAIKALREVPERVSVN